MEMGSDHRDQGVLVQMIELCTIRRSKITLPSSASGASTSEEMYDIN